MELKIIEFIKEHKDNWRELLKEPPYCITINEDDNYAIFKYSQIDSDFNEQICKECRGLIVDKNTLEPTALSFVKFFNVQETFADTINWDKARVQEKVDGSKMLVWWNKYTNKWQVSTSSQLDAYKTRIGDFNISFGDLFDRALKTLGLDDGKFEAMLGYNYDYCFTFELVSPESRVVVPYKDTKIYFIGVRFIPNFKEIDPDLFKNICEKIPRPKEYPLANLKSCLEATEKMGFDEEGFVAVDDNYHRVKIKSPAYVSAHYLKNNGVNSQSRILDIIERGEQSEFLGYFPEYKNYFDEIEEKLKNYKSKLSNVVAEIKGKSMFNVGHWTRKDFALYINKNYKEFSSFLFAVLDTDLIELFVNTQWSKLSKDQKMKRLGLKVNKEENNIEEDE